ncbi:unnamed protein product [Pedinophyceae sp. YPF-701]|nr:unnamed protein product [Pedinophyceae sp. YPF-701]
MAAGAPDALPELFEKLKGHVDNFEDEEVLHVANQVLALAPRDKDALTCKVVAGIQIGEDIAGILRCIEKCKDKATRRSLALERAYCQYRLGRFSDALATLQGVDGARAGVARQLEAQIRYKKGHAEPAAQIYQALLAQPDDSVSEREIKANLVAACTNAGRAEAAGHLTDTAAGPESSFELAFNAACAALALGRTAEAEQLLVAAERLGTEALAEDDAAPEQIKSELAPVAAQRAVVLARRGDVAGAEEALAAAKEGGSKDEAVLAVLAANAAALTARAQPGDRLPGKTAGKLLGELDAALGRMQGSDMAIKRSLVDRLSRTERASLLASCATLLMQCSRSKDAAALVLTASEKLGAVPALGLVRAALLGQRGRPGAAERVLRGVCQSGQADADVWLLRAQLALKQGGKAGRALALECLEGAPIASEPAVVATWLQVLREAEDGPRAAERLSRVVARLEGDAAVLARRALAAAQVRAGQAGAARATLAAAGGDARCAAMLARLAAIEGSGATGAAASRDGVARAAAAADVSALEAAGTGSAAARRAAAAVGDAAAGAAASGDASGPRKRKRKPRLPKGVDPNDPTPPKLDPERWLPKHERADYQRKMKKRMKAGHVKGAQGSQVDASLDAAAWEKDKKEKPKGPALPQRPKGAKGRRKR